MKPQADTSTTRGLVWDIPTRLAHVILIVGFLGAFALAEAGEHGPFFVLHMVFGLLVAFVAALRVLWGIVGTRYARFNAFSWRPSALFTYLGSLVSGRNPKYVGHNPATSYATVAMLALALGIAGTGLLMTQGFGGELEDVHEALVFTLLAIAAVHVAGVLLHAIRHRDDLVRSMVDGRKAAAASSASSASATPARAAGAVMAVLTVGLLAVTLSGYDASRGVVVVPGLGLTLGGEGVERGEGGEHDRGKDRSERREHDEGRHGNEHREHDDDD